MKNFRFPGTRVVKTGVAIFLTAWICTLLGWPPVFAVITAIVTLEPTVSDSIKKGIVRFPASAIGSAYAVLFIALFGNSPITYTLAAVFTIVTCYKLKLHAGLLVATITAVAMIEVVYDNYLLSFFIRLGTTTIGILVSTFVNMFILPPNYLHEINNKIEKIYRKMADTIQQALQYKLDQPTTGKCVKPSLEKLDGDIQKTEELIRFQKDEAKFHPLVGSKKQDFQDAQKQMNHLRLIHYHLNNLVNTPLEQIKLSKEEKETITTAIEALTAFITEKSNVNITSHQKQLKDLLELLWKDKNMVANVQSSTHLPPKLVLLYELLSIYQLVIQFYEETK